MKNHIKRYGQLLQTNKKWSALKQSQKEWISRETRSEHEAYIAENGRLPMKKRKDEIISRVYDRLSGRGVWIPYGEFHRHVAVSIDRLNHKNPLWTPPAKKNKPEKPKTPRVGIEEFPDDAISEISGIIASGVRRYILQTHRAPVNKVRDAELKNLIRGFNSTKWKSYGKLLKPSDALLDIYDETRRRIYDEISSTGNIPHVIDKRELGRLRATGVLLETERLTLRKLTAKGYASLRDTLGDAEIMALTSGQVLSTKREITQWIISQLKRYDKELTGYFAAVDRSSGEIVGQIGLMWGSIAGSRRLEVGCILKKAHWGKGYATEGAKACINYAFENLGVGKVYATVRPENTRGVNAVERVGMKPDGEYVKSCDGKKMKHLIYSITKE